jgi:hypothetical protein
MRIQHTESAAICREAVEGGYSGPSAKCTALALAPLTLWTIQHESVLEGLERDGVIRASPSRADPDYRAAYCWLAQRLADTCGAPPHGVEMPIWAWQQYARVDRAKPDLTEAGHLESGESGVCLEIVLPRQSVLLSDFTKWHFVLGGNYLPLSEAENEFFESQCFAQGIDLGLPKGELPREIQDRIERSWERIFDLDNPDEWVSIGPRSARSIQAVFWELKIGDVKEVIRFKTP